MFRLCSPSNLNLQVTLSKLKRYTEQQGGFDLQESGNDIILSFVPAFPEALEKAWTDNPAPRVTMYGKITEDTVAFNLVEMEIGNSRLTKDPEVAEFTYRSWLQYIEDNY
jgi:hypothetical protein